MSDQTDPVEEKPEQESKGGGPGGVLAILLALIAIGIASYPAYEIYKERQQAVQVDPLQARVIQVETSVEKLGGELRNIEASISGASAETSEQLAAGNDQMQSFRAEVSEAISSIQARLGTSSHDWVYAEVEYLVRMANQRVLMEQDATSALQLLQSADEIIRETDGLTAHGLREALARDIAALKAVNSPDTQGIYLELSALIAQVPALKRTLPTYEAKAPEVTNDPEAAGYFQKFLGLVRLAGNKLANLVDFRRDQVEIKRILPPTEEYFLRQNLVLKLQIAQMALLEGNGEVFSNALSEAGQWVAGSFDEDNPGTVAMLESIDRLAATQVSVELPDVTGSLKAARAQLAGFKEAQPK